MSTSIMKTPNRERLVTALDHKRPDRIPIDFGGTSVTGVHVSCVAALRDHYGLEKRPVRIHEPFQMLGIVEDDLREAMGLDVAGVFPRKTMFGFPIEKWKLWNFNELEVLVPEGFNTTLDVNGDTLIYPEGDTTVPASGRMPRGLLLRRHRTPTANRRGEAESRRQPGGVWPGLAGRSQSLCAFGAGSSGYRLCCDRLFWGDGVRRYRARPRAFSQVSQGHTRHRGMVYVHQQPAGLHPQNL